MFDLVVFENGYRGKIEHIIEILEYQGPFHYTENDVLIKGNEKAYPWKNCKISVKESFEFDKIKEKFANLYSKKFTIINPEKYKK